jgi:ABC-type multidrug transport system permease subunit
MKLPAIIKKNFKLIIRSKVSALIIIFGPLLIMFLVGMALNTSETMKVNVGYYSKDYNEMTNSFISLLNDSQYNATMYKTVDDCKEAIANGKAHICIIFPDDFQISNDRVNEVRFLVDNSKINLFQSVVDSISAKFTIRATELSTGMAADILSKLNQTQQEITSKNNIFDQMKQENRQVADQTKAIAKNISALDLGFNAAEFGISDLNVQNNGIKGSINGLRSKGLSAVNSGLDLVNDIDEALDDINISSADKKEIRDMLNETETDLNALKTEINDSYNGAGNQTTRLTTLISNVQSNLAKVEDKFTRAAAARDKIASSTLQMETQLNASMLKIIAVESSFNAISQNLAGTQVTDVQTIVSPIVTKVDMVVTEESQLNFYFPYIIVLIIMFIGIILASTLLITEKTSNAHFRNLLTPTGDFMLMMGNFFTTFIILALQVILVVLIFTFGFHKDVMANILPTSIILFLLIALFTFIGMIIGNLFNSEETGTLAAVSVSSILLFVSDLVFPLEKMPEYIAKIAQQYNPFVYGTDLLRRVMLHNRQISEPEILYGVAILAAYAVIAFILAMLIYKFSKQQFMLRASGYMTRRQLGRKYKVIEEKRLFDASKTTEEHAFKTKKDKAINLKELIAILSKMDDKEFKQYVDKPTGKNDFSVWIKDALKNEELSYRIRKETTRKGTISALRAGQKEYDLMEKDLQKQEKKDKKDQDKSQKKAKDDKKAEKMEEKKEDKNENKKESKGDVKDDKKGKDDKKEVKKDDKKEMKKEEKKEDKKDDKRTDNSADKNEDKKADKK